MPVIDFDQYPDNVFKVVPEGIVGRFSFTDFGLETGLPTMRGVDLKVCLHMPIVEGIPSGSFLVLVRMEVRHLFLGYQDDQVFVSRFHKAIDATELIDRYFYSDCREHKVYVDLSFLLHSFTNFSQRAGSFFQEIRLVLNGGDQAGGHLAYVRKKAGVRSNLIVKPSVSFSRQWISGSSRGGPCFFRFESNYTDYPLWVGSPWNIAPNVTIPTQQTLFQPLREMYPRSWWM